MHSWSWAEVFAKPYQGACGECNQLLLPSQFSPPCNNVLLQGNLAQTRRKLGDSSICVTQCFNVQMSLWEADVNLPNSGAKRQLQKPNKDKLPRHSSTQHNIDEASFGVAMLSSCWKSWAPVGVWITDHSFWQDFWPSKELALTQRELSVSI